MPLSTLRGLRSGLSSFSVRAFSAALTLGGVATGAFAVTEGVDDAFAGAGLALRAEAGTSGADGTDFVLTGADCFEAAGVAGADFGVGDGAFTGFLPVAAVSAGALTFFGWVVFAADLAGFSLDAVEDLAGRPPERIGDGRGGRPRRCAFPTTAFLVMFS